ncbi:arabinan endo-1,5-alpha-L-arabinosidase [Devosia sp.]|uniref:arabinan endo-1,5-alpha-L-arabinosidase n=1 Tax=Devosia sp. TaxID=1871048 RepID=UPI003265C55F
MRMLLALVAMILVAPAMADDLPKLTGNLFIHDPSLIQTSAGFSTFATGMELAKDGGQIRTKFSPDGINWKETGAIPGGMPAWVEREIGKRPNIWAPSVFTKGGVTYLYYSVSTFGTNDSVIGLMTNAAFDVTKPNLGWQDQGMVLRTHKGDNYNAIDPFRIDAGGEAWLVWGSYWDGIRLVALDPTSGKRSDDAAPLPLASRSGGAIEASSILEHDGKFYLFVSFDRCCLGDGSTYRMMVGRADQVTGPYLDKDGKDMMAGGGTELAASKGHVRGPGGEEPFMTPDGPKLVFHYYDRSNLGMPTLGISPIQWSAEGWPELTMPG